MRPRHVLILTLLAAIPIALALVLTGGGSSRISGGSSLARVSLQLHGGSEGGVVSRCGNSHHYRVYSSQSTIGFRGTVSPPGNWSVTVKLKACYSGAFRSSGDISGTLRPDGSYSGSFPAPIGGYYY